MFHKVLFLIGASLISARSQAISIGSSEVPEPSIDQSIVAGLAPVSVVHAINDTSVLDPSRTLFAGSASVLDFVATNNRQSAPGSFDLENNVQLFSSDRMVLARVSETPEPMTASLIGLAALSFVRRRTRKA
jgi:hypothetical protein